MLCMSPLTVPITILPIGLAPVSASSGPVRYEAWYAGMLYACFRAIGLDLRVEDSSARGRADMAVLRGGQVFVLEFKMANGEGGGDAAAQEAIGQMRDRGYAEKYMDRGAVHLVGVAFSREGRNLSALKAGLAWRPSPSEITSRAARPPRNSLERRSERGHPSSTPDRQEESRVTTW